MRTALGAYALAWLAAAGPLFAPMRVDPDFACAPWQDAWRVKCEVTRLPIEVRRDPTFEVYVDLGDQCGHANADIDQGQVVFLSRGRIRAPFAVVMKARLPGGGTRVVIKKYDAAGRLQ